MFNHHRSTFAGNAALVAVLATVLYLCSSASLAYDAASDSELYGGSPMQGISTLAVVVNDIRADYGRYGISSEDLRNSIKAQLETAGFRIIETSALASTSGAGLLKLRVKINENGYYYSYGMNLSLRRKVGLEGSGFTTVGVWSDSEVGSVQSNEFRRLGRVTDTLLNNFIQTHQRQNAG